MIDQLFKMMANWDPFGQAMFILIVLAMFGGFITGLARFSVILVRGWPPVTCYCEDEDDDECDEDGCGQGDGNGPL